MYRDRCGATLTELLPDHSTLARVAAHLGALSDDALYIEHIVGQLVTNREDPITSSLMQDLQRVDHLSQSLRDVSRLVQALATEGKDRAVGLESLKLAATRNLVSGAARPVAQQSGVVDLF